MTRYNERREGGVAARAIGAVERRVRSVFRQVTWTAVAEAAALYTDREVLALWMRAVIDSAGTIPDIVRYELAATAPTLCPVLAIANETTPDGRLVRGHDVWEHIMTSVDNQDLIEAKRRGWLDAVHYFSALSLRSMKAWAHWDRVNVQWEVERPRSLPSYGQWTRDVEAVVYLANRNSSAQHLLDMVRSLPPADWSRLASEIRLFTAFCIWAAVVRQLEGACSDRTKKEMERRYPGMLLPAAATAVGIAAGFAQWFRPDLKRCTPHCISALGFYVRSLPAYHAWQEYADQCLQSARTDALDFESWWSTANSAGLQC